MQPLPLLKFTRRVIGWKGYSDNIASNWLVDLPCSWSAAGAGTAKFVASLATGSLASCGLFARSLSLAPLPASFCQFAIALTPAIFNQSPPSLDAVSIRIDARAHVLVALAELHSTRLENSTNKRQSTNSSAPTIELKSQLVR